MTTIEKRNPSQRHADMVRQNPETFSFAKESWFKAYVLANVRWPQWRFPIALYLTNAVFTHPADTLEQVGHTYLSPDQIDRLGMIMSGQHRTHDVVNLYEKDPHDIHPARALSVTEERLSELWDQFIHWPRTIVDNYLYDRLRREDNLNTHEGLLAPSLLYQNKTSPDYLAVKAMLQSSVDTFESPTNVRLSRRWRKIYRGFRRTEDRYIHPTVDKIAPIKERLANNLRDRLTTRFPDPSPDIRQFIDYLSQLVQHH